MTKKLNHATKEQIKDFIIRETKQEKAANSKELIALMQENHGMLPEDTTNLLIELENENRLHFTKQNPTISVSSKESIFSKQASWYWKTLAFSALTMIAVFAIPENAVPLVYLRFSLSFIFVLFLPGYTFIQAFFPANNPIKLSAEELNIIERVTLSFGMSLLLVTIVDLILNYTPWGIRFTSTTLSLLALIVVFSTAAMLRNSQENRETNTSIEGHIV